MSRIFIQFFCLFLPWFLRRRLLVGLLGYDLHPDSYLGFSLIIVGEIKMGARARIGHFNLFRGLDYVELGSNSSIGNLNWFTTTNRICKAGCGRLLLGQHSAITSRHYFDVQAPISIGHYTTIAGVGSIFLTHSIDVVLNCQRSSGIKIGDYCFLSAKICVLSGSEIASKIVVAAGAVVANSLAVESMLYGGVPARQIKEIDGNKGYFVRDVGFVD
jgi:acetyltransferase-like isoleucine patch superfamily enzyme